MNNMLKAVAILSGVGIYIAAIIFICIYLGSIADDFFNLGGKGKIIGIFLAFPISGCSIWRRLKIDGFL